MKPIPKLKPCPWCKEQPRFWRIGGSRYRAWVVECDTGRCPVHPATRAMSSTRREAAEEWNGRKP